LHRVIVTALVVLTPTIAGCFSERSFVMRPEDYVPAPAVNSSALPAGDTRAWLAHAHQTLRHTLPYDDEPALTTEQLVDPAGNPVDVYAHFGRCPEYSNSIFLNFFGLMDTAQASGAEAAIENPAAPWPGFEDVWAPINDRLQLSGRLGLARGADGEPLVADCIIVLPGLLGDLAVKRSRDLARALVDAGHHVLALELRGFGQTERRFPDVYYTFGVLETGDLLAVDEWLQQRPYVRGTGLIGFCWGANHVLLAAWEDGREEDHPGVAPELRKRLRPRDGRRHFTSGVLAFSPTLDFEPIVEVLRQEWPAADEPVLCTLQDGVRDRMRRKRHPEINGDLGRLIQFEFARSELTYPHAVRDGYDYLRFLPYRGKPAGDKLESARVPVLIVHGSNDPLASPQAVADLIASTENRNVAAVVLDGGGHVGFAPYDRSYFYSLVLNFFDPRAGPATRSAKRRP
jgi:predicted alpha/beta-fold hydrolase